MREGQPSIDFSKEMKTAKSREPVKPGVKSDISDKFLSGERMIEPEQLEKPATTSDSNFGLTGRQEIEFDPNELAATNETESTLHLDYSEIDENTARKKGMTVQAAAEERHKRELGIGTKGPKKTLKN